MWARVIEDNTVVEIINFDPAGHFHESLIWRPIPIEERDVITVNVFKIDENNNVIAPLDTYKEVLKKRLEGCRWVKEANGVTLTSGKTIWSDRINVASLNNLKTALDSNIITEATWKCKDRDWLTINSSNIDSILSDLIRHTEKCFKSEKIVFDEIEAATDKADLLTFNVLGRFEEEYIK